MGICGEECVCTSGAAHYSMISARWVFRIQILLKPGTLTPKMADKVKTPRVAYQIVIAHIALFTTSVGSFLTGHHEKWDGSGIPAGLEGEIKFHTGQRRIFSLVDEFVGTQLRSDRPYRPAWSARGCTYKYHIRQSSGIHFDPEGCGKPHHSNLYYPHHIMSYTHIDIIFREPVEKQLHWENRNNFFQTRSFSIYLFIRLII